MVAFAGAHEPASHLVHEQETVDGTDPAAQEMAHSKHVVEAAAGAWKPGSQGVHTEAPMEEKKPDAHAMQEALEVAPETALA